MSKDPYEAKYQYLIKKTWKNGLKNMKDPKGFIQCSSDMLDVTKILNITIPSENVMH